MLKAGEADRVLAGHPWIYDTSLLKVTGDPEDGSVVQVRDHRRRFLGVGFFNSRSRIRVRLLDRERVTVDREFFRDRIERALEVRRRQLPGASSYRAVNAESDFLSGLIVDKYEDVLVLQTTSLGMDRHKDEIVEVLGELFQPRVILERNDVAARRFEGLDEKNAVLYGELEDEINIKLNGLTFRVNFLEGHKTGFYLDQQVNYRRVAEWARGGRVLDGFSFQGGFAIHAARAGAAQVEAIEQSEAAIQTARQNAELNGVDTVCHWTCANVFDWLKEKASGESSDQPYDLIILDPPSFTRTRANIPQALRGYKEIHLRALKLLKRGGILATFCCSHHIDADTFQRVILEAALDARKILRRIEIYSQSPDHPVIPAIPETEYLKGFAFEVAV